jgi:hypothetical protein
MGMSRSAQISGVPAPLVDVVKQRARRVGGVGRVDGAAGQLPDQEAVDRAEQQLAPLRPRPRAFDRVEDPLELRAREIGVQQQPVFAVTIGSCPSSRRRRRWSAVRRSCQTMARWIGCRCRAVPDQRRLALVGDADGGDPSGGDAPPSRSPCGRSPATVDQRSSGSCSTQPESGKCWGNSSCAVADHAQRRRTGSPGSTSCPGRWPGCGSSSASPLRRAVQAASRVCWARIQSSSAAPGPASSAGRAWSAARPRPRPAREFVLHQPAHLDLGQRRAEIAAKLLGRHRALQDPLGIGAVGAHEPPRPAVGQEGMRRRSRAISASTPSTGKSPPGSATPAVHVPFGERCGTTFSSASSARRR